MKQRKGESRDEFRARQSAYRRELSARHRNDPDLAERRRERKRAEYARFEERHPGVRKERAHQYYLANRQRLLARAKAYKEAHAEENQAYQAAYRQANIVSTVGEYINRRTHPPEVVAVAELIRETYAVLREMRKGA